MSELARIVTHYLEQIARRANLKGFDEIRAEIDAAVESDQQDLDKRFENLRNHIDLVEEKVDQPDWRQRT